jgi:hypothetical protein
MLKMNVLQSKVSGISVTSQETNEEVANDGISDYTKISENQLNITFDIDIPYDILIQR